MIDHNRAMAIQRLNPDGFHYTPGYHHVTIVDGDAPPTWLASARSTPTANVFRATAMKPRPRGVGPWAYSIMDRADGATVVEV
jgi:hypothetical protein